MDRRDFLKKSLVIGGAAGIAIATGDAEAKEALGADELNVLCVLHVSFLLSA